MLDAAVWIPDKKDVEKKITYRWNEKQKISSIEFFENSNKNCNIYKILVISDDEEKYYFSDIALYDSILPIEEYSLPCRLASDSILTKAYVKDRLVSLYDYFLFPVNRF